MFKTTRGFFRSASLNGNNDIPNHPSPSADFKPHIPGGGPGGIPGAASFLSGSQAFVPPNALDHFIPGYSLISSVLLQLFGIDINSVISVAFLVFTFFTAGKFLWTRLGVVWNRYFTCSITINSDEKIYQYVMDWVSETKIPKSSRNLCAKSRKKDWEEELDLIKAFNEEADKFNFKEWESKSVPAFEPAIGVHRFWHNGSYISLTRREREMNRQGGYFWYPGSSGADIREIMTISCTGRSTTPLKLLLQEAKRWYLAKQKSNTTIFHPINSGRGSSFWRHATFRPSRPLDTITMSEIDKRAILDDIHQYLHPESRPWYATRGIPYRRGFLFHGPPGTGKTSLSFALAGVFGLDIYVMSLMDPLLSEDALKSLFNELPRRCIVLLEDIDTAGLRRTAGKQASGDGVAAKEAAEDDEKPKRGSKKDDGISMSGLLNAIDGVASHEGRLLIMTTNHPEKLDEALIRPGRVDMKIGFGYATKDQSRTLFMQMYAPDHLRVDGDSHATGNGNANGFTLLNKMNGSASGIGKSKRSNSIDMGKLRLQADVFAEIVPHEVFTPAEVQGFLLTRRHDPKKAVDEAIPWREALLKEKAERKAAIAVEEGKEIQGTE